MSVTLSEELQLAQNLRDRVPGVTPAFKPGHHSAPSGLEGHAARYFCLPPCRLQQVQIQAACT